MPSSVNGRSAEQEGVTGGVQWPWSKIEGRLPRAQDDESGKIVRRMQQLDLRMYSAKEECP